MLVLFLSGCTSQPKINAGESTLIKLNSDLPKKIAKTIKLLFVFQEEKNGKNIFVYNYQLMNYEKSFLNFNSYKTNIYKNRCNSVLTNKESLFIKFIYYDKYYNYLGKINYNKYSCKAMQYVFHDNIKGFKKYLYSLSDDKYLSIGLGYNYLPKIFETIYSDRFGDIEIK